MQNKGTKGEMKDTIQEETTKKTAKIGREGRRKDTGKGCGVQGRQKNKKREQ